MQPLFLLPAGWRKAVALLALISTSTAGAQSFHITTFATGSAVSATQPDSINVTNHFVWVSYGNGAVSTGGTGASTVVRYKRNSGKVLNTYSLAGSVDGLKVDPTNGQVWALQNQDGNSTLTLIDPEDGTVSKPIPYAVASATRGYDDVAFRLDEVFLSYTNPASATDPTIVRVQEESNPIAWTPVLQMGALGTNLATGQTNQPTSQNDPDSLKLTPRGDLMLTSGDDGQLIFVSQPGTPRQAVSFLSLLDPTNKPVSGLDDAVFVTSRKGTFFLADTGNNRILKIDAAQLHVGSLYASVGSLNALVRVDLNTGVVTPVSAT
jgi:hypothetical protein